MGRNNFVDALRGFAILSMIVGHSIIKVLPAYNQNAVYQFIYSYHMPLFFAVSGYIMYSTFKTNTAKWIGDKAKKLLIPHFGYNIAVFFYSITGLTLYANLANQLSFLSWIQQSTVYDSGEWFLWTLFIVFCLMVLIKSFESGKTFVLSAIAITIIIFLAPLNNGALFKISYVQFCFPFTVIGYMVAKYDLQRFIHKRMVAVALPVLLAVFIIGRVHFPDVWANYPTSNVFYKGYLINFGLALVSIPLIIFVVWLISKIRFSGLAWIGRNSLPIYIVSMLFVGLYFVSGITGIIMSAVLSFLIAVVFVMAKNKIMNLQRA